MPTFKLPLSGDVVQSINPWFMSPIGSQFGLVNITLGQSSEPQVEADVLSDVASYGKQLGRIGDALIVLLAHFQPATPLNVEERKAIADLAAMLDGIADKKEHHRRPALRPRRPVAATAAVASAPAESPEASPSAPAATSPAPEPPPARPGRRPGKSA